MPIEKKITVLFLIIFIGIFIPGILSFRNNKSVIDTGIAAANAKDALLQTEKVLSLAEMMQTSVRGYIITHDSSFLSPFFASSKNIYNHINSLKQLMGNTEYAKKTDSLEQLVEGYKNLSFNIIKNISAKNNSSSFLLASLKQGEGIMNDTRQIINVLQQYENNALTKTTIANAENQAKQNNTFVFLLMSAVVFLTFAFLTVMNYIKFRKKAEAEAVKINKELEQRVAQKTKEALETSRKYQFVLDNMQEGIQILSSDWHYLYVNDAVIKQSKTTADKLIGQSFLKNYPGVETTELFRALLKSMKEQKSMHLENEFIFPDNSKGYFDLSVQPVPEGLVILSTDISERKKLEQEKEQYLKEIQEILFKISHEIRHPVVQILSVSQLLEETTISMEEFKTIMSYMKKSALLLNTYTKDLTAFINSIHLSATVTTRDTVNFKN